VNICGANQDSPDHDNTGRGIGGPSSILSELGKLEYGLSKRSSIVTVQPSANQLCAFAFARVAPHG